MYIFLSDTLTYGTSVISLVKNIHKKIYLSKYGDK